MTAETQHRHDPTFWIVGARSSAAVALGLLLSMSTIGAQTVITPPTNRYTVAEDVQLGREAAAEVEKQLPKARFIRGAAMAPEPRHRRWTDTVAGPAG